MHTCTGTRGLVLCTHSKAVVDGNPRLFSCQQRSLALSANSTEAVVKKGSGTKRHLSCALKEEQSLDKWRGWETSQYLDFSNVFIMDISHVHTRREDSIFKNPPTFHPASTLVNISLVYFENKEGFRVRVVKIIFFEEIKEEAPL